jgi:hypothetical protein
LKHHREDDKEDEKLAKGAQNQEETRDVNADEGVETPFVQEDQG